MRHSLVCLIGTILVVATANAQSLKLREPAIGADGVRIEAMAFTPDGKSLITSNVRFIEDGGRREVSINIWDTATLQKNSTIPLQDQPPEAFAIDSNAKRLALTTSRGMVAIYDLGSGKRQDQFRVDFGAATVAFRPDANSLIMVGGRCTTIDLATRKQTLSFNTESSGYPPALNSDMSLLAVPKHQDLFIWDVNTGKQVAILPDHHGSVNQVQFSPDGKRLFALCMRNVPKNRYECHVRVWDVAKRTEVATLRGRFSVISRMSLSPDGNTLALLGGDDSQDINQLELIESLSGKSLAHVRVPGHRRQYLLAYSPAGKTIAVGGEDQRVRLWDIVP